MLGAVSPTLAGIAGRAIVKLLEHGISRRLSPATFDLLPLGYLLVAEKPA